MKSDRDETNPFASLSRRLAGRPGSRKSALAEALHELWTHFTLRCRRLRGADGSLGRGQEDGFENEGQCHTVRVDAQRKGLSAGFNSLRKVFLVACANPIGELLNMQPSQSPGSLLALCRTTRPTRSEGSAAQSVLPRKGLCQSGKGQRCYS